MVAPFTGAWIETLSHNIIKKETSGVAPFTGAWIETLDGATILNILVAPFTGAWIETRKDMRSTESLMSHPSRVRGLKPRGPHCDRLPGLSHPSRVRGLKLFSGWWVPGRQRRTLHGCVD